MIRRADRQREIAESRRGGRGLEDDTTRVRTVEQVVGTPLDDNSLQAVPVADVMRRADHTQSYTLLTALIIISSHITLYHMMISYLVVVADHAPGFGFTGCSSSLLRAPSIRSAAGCCCCWCWCCCCTDTKKDIRVVGSRW